MTLGGRVAFFPSAVDGRNSTSACPRRANARAGSRTWRLAPPADLRPPLVVGPSPRGAGSHIHFVQPFYAYETVHARLRWVRLGSRATLLARAFGYWTDVHAARSPVAPPLRPAWVDYLGYWVAANLSHRVIVHCGPRAALRARYGPAGVHVVEHPSF